MTTRKAATMKSRNSAFAHSRDSRNSQRTYSREQRAVQKEFCDAYGFDPEQVSFDRNSVDPIFDFDALALLSTRLCDLPHVSVEPGDINAAIGMVTATGYAVLSNGNTRKIFGSAVVGEPMHDGGEIKDIHQAMKVARARGLRTILRAVGFDPVQAHRSFRNSGNVIDLQLPAKTTRDRERAEIHMLAQGLGLVTKLPSAVSQGKVTDRFDRSAYENAIATFFHGKRSSTDLTDQEHSQFLAILRAWARAHAIANDGRTAKAS